jgi:hypothetical protein
MATGAAPAFDSQKPEAAATDQTPESKPATLKERIFQKLAQIFQHNENLGPTRH